MDKYWLIGAMIHMLKNIKLIVFDLDGTLYADTHHFDYYAHQLMVKLPSDIQDPFLKEYQQARLGRHVIKIGRVYDAENDLVLYQKEQTVKEVFEWNGYRLPEERVAWLYPDPITIDNVRMLSVGDLWWVPVPIARHYGLESKKCHQAFLETREYMMGPEFKMNRVPGLKETLADLRTKKKLVLLTNSPKPDSLAILEKLGLRNMFHKMIFSGEKPTRTKERFETVSREFGVGYSDILSVGDNWVNEIKPVQELGGKTLFINQYLGEEYDADYVVKSIKEALPILIKNNES